ncbi:metallophosphoesterase [Candidatus Saccharibacteria bacterium]|nr:MAG: metallophosphoesterase [Candidatus Saccharibacteria bacterium]
MSLRIPPAANTIHCIGDTHISYFFTPVKQSILLRDLAKPSVPKVAYTFQVGDHTNEQPGEDTAALAFYDELRTQFGTEVYVTYGNHDIRSTVASPTMGPADNCGLCRIVWIARGKLYGGYRARYCYYAWD